MDKPKKSLTQTLEAQFKSTSEMTDAEINDNGDKLLQRIINESVSAMVTLEHTIEQHQSILRLLDHYQGLFTPRR